MGQELESIGLVQPAVLWPRSASANNYGEERVDGPIPIMTRWNFTKTNSSNPQTNTSPVTATVIVDRKVETGSLLWLGKLVDLPSTPTDIVKVISYNEVNDIKGRNIRHITKVTKCPDGIPGGEGT